MAAAFVIFGMSGWVIYYRFMTTPETNCAVVVAGNPSLEGFSVTVERLTQDPAMKRSYSDTLNPGNQFYARFFLSSGTYHVEVRDAKQERVLSESEFIPPGTRLSLDLNRKYPQKRTTTEAEGASVR